MSAHSNENHVLTLAHNRGAFAKGITVLFTPTQPADIVFDITGGNHHGANATANPSGTYQYGRDYVKIPIWGGGNLAQHWDGNDWHIWKSGFLKVIVHF